MQVPEHVVSLYVATCGLSGPGLGSDEKEIILLVYVILEATTGKIIGTKQLLVRPDGSLVKDRTISTSSDTSITATAATSPPPSALSAIAYPTDINCNSNSNNNTTNSNLNLNNNATTATNITTNINATCNATSIAANNNSSSSTTNPIITTINNSSNNINCNSNNVANTSISNGPLSITPTTPTTALAITATTDHIIELPIAIAQAAGKPLSEAIEEFDEYLRSLSLNDADDIKLITDGQLPLRQCLHREACAKDVELPAYYNKFCDLRKEFSKYKSGDLSRALVPVKDIKKMLQLPVLPAPQSIAEMLKELNITSTDDTEFYVRESRDMVSVIQTLLKAGHKFTANEIVNLVLEPGICSIDDEIDGNCIVRARGLPWQSSDQDIAKFFRGLNVAKGGVALCLSPLGRRNGEALIRFVSQEHRDMALKRHKHHIGNRYIEVYRATGEDFLAIAGGASNEAQAFLSKGAQVIIRMRGLPYDCTAKQVLDFFTNGDNPCNVLDATEGVLFVRKPDGRATGDAFVLFSNEADAPKALARHRESIGQRYIELFRSTTAEVQQVLNRSMDPKTYEHNHQPPLIAQLPTMQLSLLPQHLITSGTTKNCIRLRGLPYEALVEHILHFLDDFAKHIIYQGVHMVINAQGQPSGEAFIQMDSEESARLCAHRKHNHFMVFGKKYRYIEVFQCSGDDMNMVLNGGLQSPVAAHHPHHPTGKQPSLLSPVAASVIGAPFSPFGHFVPPTPMLASPHRAHHPHAPHPHHSTTFYPHRVVYWSYSSPPVSPTTYFSQQPTHSPTHIAGNMAAAAAASHQTMYSMDFLAAVPPTNYATQVPQAPPMSPPSVAIPTTAGLIISPNKTPTMTLVPPKQFSPLPTPPPLTPIPAAATAVGHTTKLYKIPIHHAPIVTSAQQQQPQTSPASNHYHYSASVAAANNLAAIPEAATSNIAMPTMVTGAPTQALLAIDTVSAHKPLTKVTNSTFTPNNANAAPNAINGSNGSNAVIANVAPNMSGQGAGIVPNPCVELYIS